MKNWEIRITYDKGESNQRCCTPQQKRGEKCVFFVKNKVEMFIWGGRTQQFWCCDICLVRFITEWQTRRVSDD